MSPAAAPTCPVCGRGDLLRRREHGAPGRPRFVLWRCPGCGVEHWDPRAHPTAAFYEDEGLSMYADFHEGRRGPDDPRFAKFLAELGDGAGRRVLDVGCSDGVLLDCLKARGCDPWGIDIDGRALEIARGRGLANVFRQEVEEFARDARARGLAFALVIAFDVLEHLTDPLAALRDLGTVLEPGGRLVATVPNRRRLLADHVSSDLPPHHFFRFDAPSLADIVVRAGLEVERVDAFEYGYVGRVALDAAWKRVRGPRPAAAAPGPAAGGTAASSGPARPRLALKHAVARAVLAAVGPLSQVLERPLGRGFKLYLVARRAGPA